MSLTEVGGLPRDGRLEREHDEVKTRVGHPGGVRRRWGSFRRQLGHLVGRAHDAHHDVSERRLPQGLGLARPELGCFAEQGDHPVVDTGRGRELDPPLVEGLEIGGKRRELGRCDRRRIERLDVARQPGRVVLVGPSDGPDEEEGDYGEPRRYHPQKAT